MRKINSKGLTLTELIVSFAIVAVAIVYFYQTIYTVRRLYTKAQTETQEYVDKNYAIRVVDAYIDKNGYDNLNVKVSNENKICSDFNLKYLDKEICTSIESNVVPNSDNKLREIIIKWNDGKKVSFHKANNKPVVQVYVEPILAENRVNQSFPFFNYKKNGLISKTGVRSITFQTNINTPSGYKEGESWDASQKGDGSVKAWYKLGVRGLYDIVIGANGKVVFPESCAGMFDKMTQLKEINFNGAIDTKKVKSMTNMFSRCYNLVGNLDLSDFDTVNVETMSLMFNESYSLSEITFGSNFTANKVSTMQQMFNECKGLKTLDLSEFDTASLTNTSMMFNKCFQLRGITFGKKFNTSLVDNMSYMFYNCGNLQSLNLSSFSTNENVAASANSMFGDCQGLKSINFGNKTEPLIIKNASYMFGGCLKLQNLDLSRFNTKNVTKMSNMFDSCQRLESITFGDNFITSNVIEMNRMFFDCEMLKGLNLTTFTFNNVTSYSSMFWDYHYKYCNLPIYVKDEESKNLLLKIKSDLRNIIIGSPSV